MKINKLIAFLLIFCIIFSLCACAEKEETVAGSVTGTTDNNADAQNQPAKKIITTKDDIVLGNDADMFFYSGHAAFTAIYEDVDSDYAKKYNKELARAGYKKYTQSSFNGSEENTANTFTTYQTEDYYVDVGHHSNAGRMYVTYTPVTERWVLPAKKRPKYKKCGLPTTVTQLGAERFHKAAVSMCYIVRAADGSFVIVDTDFGKSMAEVIYDTLKKQAPDPDNIVISAWILTHPHLDHVGGFIEFAEKYKDDKTITTKQVVYNFPDDTHISNSEKKYMRKTATAARQLGDNVTFVRPHAGSVLYYADLTFRVLYTQEEYLYPTAGKIKNVNGASLVVQMETKNGKKVLFGADHTVNGSYNGTPYCEGALYKWYGDFIKSDVVTCFHHGLGGGADLEVYKHIKPSIVLWPATFYRLTHDSNGKPYANIEFHKRNLYFSDPVQAKQNGVKGYYIAGDKIHIVDLSGKEITVTEYKTCDEYFGK